MKTYNLYKSNIESEIELSKNQSNSKRQIDFTIKEVKKSPIFNNFEWFKRFHYKKRLWMSYAKKGNEFGIRFHSFADFRINLKKNEINFHKRKSTDNNTIRHLLIDQVIPLALSLQSKTLVHSSSVKIGNSAVSFQAPSGSGKSTIAAYFTTKNHKLLTDDTLLLEEIRNRNLCSPQLSGYPVMA